MNSGPDEDLLERVYSKIASAREELDRVFISDSTKWTARAPASELGKLRAWLRSMNEMEAYGELERMETDLWIEYKARLEAFERLARDKAGDMMQAYRGLVELIQKRLEHEQANSESLTRDYAHKLEDERRSSNDRILELEGLVAEKDELFRQAELKFEVAKTECDTLKATNAELVAGTEAKVLAARQECECEFEKAYNEMKLVSSQSLVDVKGEYEIKVAGLQKKIFDLEGRCRLYLMASEKDAKALQQQLSELGGDRENQRYDIIKKQIRAEVDKDLTELERKHAASLKQAEESLQLEKDRHADEMSRLQRRMEADLAQLSETHRREIDELRDAHKRAFSDVEEREKLLSEQLRSTEDSLLQEREEKVQDMDVMRTTYEGQVKQIELEAAREREAMILEHHRRNVELEQSFDLAQAEAKKAANDQMALRVDQAIASQAAKHKALEANLQYELSAAQASLRQAERALEAEKLNLQREKEVLVEDYETEMKKLEETLKERNISNIKEIESTWKRKVADIEDRESRERAVRDSQEQSIRSRVESEYSKKFEEARNKYESTLAEREIARRKDMEKMQRDMDEDKSSVVNGLKAQLADTSHELEEVRKRIITEREDHDVAVRKMMDEHRKEMRAVNETWETARKEWSLREDALYRDIENSRSAFMSETESRYLSQLQDREAHLKAQCEAEVRALRSEIEAANKSWETRMSEMVKAHQITVESQERDSLKRLEELTHAHSEELQKVHETFRKTSTETLRLEEVAQTKRVEYLDRKHSEEIDDLKRTHAIEIESIRQAHQRELEEAARNHSRQMDEAGLAHSSELADMSRLLQDVKDELEIVTEEKEALGGQYNALLQEAENTMQELEKKRVEVQRLEAERESLINEWEARLSQLHQTLEANQQDQDSAAMVLLNSIGDKEVRMQIQEKHSSQVDGSTTELAKACLAHLIEIHQQAESISIQDVQKEMKMKLDEAQTQSAKALERALREKNEAIRSFESQLREERNEHRALLQEADRRRVDALEVERARILELKDLHSSEIRKNDSVRTRELEARIVAINANHMEERDQWKEAIAELERKCEVEKMETASHIREEMFLKNEQALETFLASLATVVCSRSADADLEQDEVATEMMRMLDDRISSSDDHTALTQVHRLSNQEDRFTEKRAAILEEYYNEWEKIVHNMRRMERNTGTEKEATSPNRGLLSTKTRADTAIKRERVRYAKLLADLECIYVREMASLHMEVARASAAWIHAVRLFSPDESIEYFINGNDDVPVSVLCRAGGHGAGASTRQVVGTPLYNLSFSPTKGSPTKAQKSTYAETPSSRAPGSPKSSRRTTTRGGSSLGPSFDRIPSGVWSLLPSDAKSKIHKIAGK